MKIDTLFLSNTTFYVRLRQSKGKKTREEKKTGGYYNVAPAGATIEPDVIDYLGEVPAHVRHEHLGGVRRNYGPRNVVKVRILDETLFTLIRSFVP